MSDPTTNHQPPTLRILAGDSRETLRELADESVHCCVTSPPYWGLRDYGHAGQIGQEASPDAYVAQMVALFAEVRRVLRKDGTLWLNLGDSYAGSWGAQSRPNGNDIGSTLGGGSMLSARQIEAHPRDTNTGSLKNTPGLKAKDLIGIPWRVAFALQADGWWLREDIIWAKPNCMPESVTDRCTRSHEYIFHLAKSQRYFHDAEAIKEPASDWHASVPGREDGPGQDRRSKKPREALATDKQSGHGRRHGGFNERWDESEQNGTAAATRNKRSVWTVPPANYPDAHFATFPPALIQPCILAGCPVGGTVLDPFGGSGTTGQVALELARSAILCELNPEYIALIKQRCTTTPGLPLS